MKDNFEVRSSIGMFESAAQKQPRTYFRSDKKHKEGLSWKPGMCLIAQIAKLCKVGQKEKAGRRPVAVTVLTS
jgi:hypothetical protein